MVRMLTRWGALVAILATFPARADERSAAQADNQFAFELLRTCRASLREPNLFLSPPSLAFALSMVENGARGATLRQIADTLRAPSQLAAMNQDNQALLAALGSVDTNIQLRVANSLWVDERARLLPEFINVNKATYRAEVANADFHNPATVNRINSWVKEHTDGKISSIVDRLDPMLRLIVLNAIYFKGDWTEPFAKKLTRELPFTLANGEVIQHPRMKRTGKFEYFSDQHLQAVTLPYGDGDICMDIFLPKEPLTDFVHEWTADKYLEHIRQMRSTKGTLELPRFKLENEYALNQVLQKMGIRLAFTDQADFSGMSEEPLLISWVKQKTYVEVNEQGTVAAAVTGVGVRAMAVMREPAPFHMVVDHPFFVAIRDRRDGLVLFLGAIADPR